MKHTLTLTAALLTTVASLWASPGAAQDADPDVAATYRKVCAQCHHTNVGPELRGRHLPPEYVSFIVRNGFRAMPAFPHSALDDDTLNRIAAMIQASPQPE